MFETAKQTAHGVELIPFAVVRVCRIYFICPWIAVWRRGGLMVSALVPRSSGQGSSPGLGCSVLGQDTLFLQCFLHPGL